jgi:hypothetical protein
MTSLTTGKGLIQPFAEFRKFNPLQEIYLLLDRSSERWTTVAISVPKTATLTCGSVAQTIEENTAIYGHLELHHPMLPPENRWQNFQN